MYNLLFPEDRKKVDGILKLIGRKRSDFGRFRSIWIFDEFIFVLARNGGSGRKHKTHSDKNREPGEDCWCTGCIQTYRIPKIPGYLIDYDCAFDDTYCMTLIKSPIKNPVHTEEGNAVLNWLGLAIKKEV